MKAKNAPKPPKKHRGGISISPLGLPLKRPKGRGCGPYPLETHPGLFSYRLFTLWPYFVTAKGFAVPGHRYGVRGPGQQPEIGRPGEGSKERGPAGPLPWSVGEGFQGEGESKRPPLGIFSGGLGGVFSMRKRWPPGRPFPHSGGTRSIFET